MVDGLRCGARVLGLLLGGAVAWAPAPARAAEPRDAARAAHLGGQRSFGVGPAAGLHTGFGALASLELEPVGAVVSGGYLPLFVFGNEGADQSLTMNYYGSFEFNADLLVGPVYKTGKGEFHVVAGYRHNTVLGHGFGLGVRFGLDLSRLWRLELYWTPNVFPDASARLEEEGYPADRDASLPELQGGIGAALVLYP